jgi:hypothetical protein
MIRTRTLSPTDPACYIVSTNIDTYLNESNLFGSLDAARLFTKDAAAYAMRDAYRAMVHYVPLSVIHLPDSTLRKFFYI